MFKRHLIMAVLALSCTGSVRTGTVHISSPVAGTFEIFRIAGESPMQLVAEEIGKFNADIELVPGSYLILADCSSEPIIVRPGTRETLQVYEVRFETPSGLRDVNAFSIQCSRFDKTQSRQNIRDTYSLKILSGRHELLVGMVPLEVNLTPDAFSKPESAGAKSYQLSALQVANPESVQDQTTPFFVSPQHGSHAVTEAQQLGHWQFLLPGQYQVELNGTTLGVDLKESEMKLIQAAQVRVETSPKIPLDRIAKVTGSPTNIEINSDHWFSVNETYLVLPGTAELRLDASIAKHSVQFTEGKTTTLRPKSVMVEQLCEASGNPCDAEREVFLYQGNALYPFAKAATNMPILFFESDVAVSVAGSRDVRYLLPNAVTDASISLGQLVVEMDIEKKTNMVTDLVRVVAEGGRLTGATVDLPFQKRTVLPLFEGRYYVDQFMSGTRADSDRKRLMESVYIRSGDTQTVKIKVFVTEKKYAQLSGRRYFH
jgi:hypothetical protein